MILGIMQLINEFRYQDEHMQYMPLETKDPQVNFDELVQLSQRTSSGFSITGEHQDFVISVESPTPFYMLLCSIPLVVPFFVADDYLSIYFWMTEILFLSIILFFAFVFRNGRTTYDFQFNSNEQKILIKPNSIIGRFYRQKITIDYKDFNRISGEYYSADHRTKIGKITYSGVRTTILYCKTNIEIVPLTTGPYFYINYKVFIICLNNLINYHKNIE